MALGNKTNRSIEKIAKDLDDIRKNQKANNIQSPSINNIDELILGLTAAGMYDISGAVNSQNANSLLNGDKSFLRYIKNDISSLNNNFSEFMSNGADLTKCMTGNSVNVHLTGIEPGIVDDSLIGVGITLSGDSDNVDSLINLLNTLGGEESQETSMTLLTLRDTLTNLSEIKIDAANFQDLEQLPNIMTTLSNSFKGIDMSSINTQTIKSIKTIVGDLVDINSVLSSLTANEETNETIKIINENISNVVDVMNTISSIKLKGIKTKQKVLTDGVIAIGLFVEAIDKNFPQNQTLDKAINKILVKGDVGQKIDDTNKLIEQLPEILQKLKDMAQSISDKDIENIKKSVDSIKVVIDALNKIDVKVLKKCIDLVESIEKMIVIFSAVLIISALVMKFIEMEYIFKYLLGVMTLVAGVGMIVLLLYKYGKDLENSSKLIHELSIFVFLSSLALIAGSYVAQFVSFKDILKFIGGLLLLMTGVFLISTMLSLPIFNKIADNMKNLSELGILVFMCGLSLAIASWIGKNVDPTTILAFGFALSLLMFSILTPLTFFNGVKNFMEDTLSDLGLLVLTCALTLLLGSALFHFIPLADILGFSLLLGVFVLGIVAALTISSRFSNKKSIVQMGNFGMIVFLSAVSLLLGSYIYRYIPAKDIIGFEVLLLLFVGGIALAVGLAQRIANGKGEVVMKNLTALIIVSSICMLIGGMLFMNYPDLPLNVLMFAGILCGFISIISIAVGFATKLAGGKGMLSMIGLALIIGVSALAITLGPTYMKEHDISWEDVLLFAGELVGFVGVMAVMLALMGLIAPSLGLGILCAAGIAVIVFGFTWVMGYMKEVYKDIDYNKLDAFMNSIEGLISSISVIAGLMSLAAPFIAVGELLIGGILALVVGICKTMEIMKNTFKKTGHIPEKDINYIGEFLKGVIKQFDVLSLKDFVTLPTKTSIIKNVASAVTSVAFAIQSFANLKMPQYNEKGEITGYVSMTETDFVNASTNIGLVITNLAGAIMDVLKTGDKSLVEELLKPAGFLGGTTKFGKLLDSTGKLGHMISEIAKGVKDYAELRIPEYDKNGNQKGTRQMGEPDFKAAADSIKHIITTVGGAVMNLANTGDNELIKLMLAPASLFSSDTKFGKLIESVTKIGEMISKIAQGVKDYADLRIPDQFNEDGSIKSYRTLDKPDFDKVEENIPKLITIVTKSTFDTINELMNNDAYEDFFDDTDNIEAFTKNVDMITSTMGNVIENMIKTVDSAVKAGFVEPLVDLFIFKPFRKTIESVLWTQQSNSDPIWYIYKNPNDTTAYLRVLNTIGNTIKSFAKNISEIKTQLFKTNSEGLSNTIKNILTVIEDQINDEANQKFETHKNSLKEYIETINSIDVSKVDKMVDLIDSITELRMQFDDMGKFADVFANKIAGILTELTVKIDDANKTINKTDQLNEKRKKLIKESVGKIKELMNKEMVVKIKPEEKEKESDTPTISSNPGSTASTPTNTGGDNTSTNIFNSGSNAAGNSFGGSNNNEGSININRTELQQIITAAILAAKNS